MIDRAPTQTIQITLPTNRTVNEILRILGEPENVAARALRHYLLDVCLQRMEQARQKINHYEEQYGTDYATFSQRIGSDESFLETVNRTYPMWEADAIEWVYRMEEDETWRNRSQTILREL